MIDDKESLKEISEKLILQKIKVEKETEKLKELKDKIIELSKNQKSSFKIQTNLGLIKVLRNKSNIFYSIQSKEFNQLDVNLRRQLINDNFILMTFRINQEKYRNNKDKKVLGILDKIVNEKPKKPFNVTIAIDKNIDLHNVEVHNVEEPASISREEIKDLIEEKLEEMKTVNYNDDYNIGDEESLKDTLEDYIEEKYA
jgi:hypothetical protein